jgi:hypothetical protein
MSRHPEIYKAALDVQNACNGQAVLRTLVKLIPDMVEDMKARGNETDTDSINSHPVMKVFLCKIADLAHIPINADMTEDAFRICEERASSTGDCPKGYSLWIKRLGQTHLCGPSSSHTLCGMPMLGNNYEKVLPEAERKHCPDCAKALQEIESVLNSKGA